MVKNGMNNYTFGIKASDNDTQRIISVTNNRAQYFADLAQKYRDEAKQHRDNAKLYAEQNSDVTFEQINNLKSELLREIAKKQDLGDYALNSDIPLNVSELNNDSEYVNKNELNSAISEVELPSQENCAGKVLMSDGENEKWAGINSFELFDTKITDCLLEGEKSLGWALQGTYVSKSIYPDFYNKVIEEKEASTASEMTLAGSNILIYINSNGHQYYDISDKEIVDNFYLAMGSAWFYGVDAENERIFLPRQNFLNLTDKTILPVAGNGMTLGLDDGSGVNKTLGSCVYNSGSHTFTSTAGYGLPVGTATPYSSWYSYYTAIGVTSDSTKSGIESKLADFKDESKYLYICVGNTTVNEALVDVGNLSSDLQYKADCDLSNCTKPYITETYQNGTSWYRVYSDGWCEQGGLASHSADVDITITFLKSFKDINYTLLVTTLSASSYAYNEIAHVGARTKTATNFVTRVNGALGLNKSWYACGYLF